ncbi:MAG: UDP-N-acetylmuramate--L-alanine ligase, partial [Clostridia bacterium]|nr:UDP-N-acetylmuramate--L-alanine ligase [Clostridia bacterium]
VVYLSAIGDSDPELHFARRNKIRCMERKAYLAVLASECKSVIAIAGSHGKTTTTAMLCHVAERIPLEFMGHVGGIINGEDSNFINTGRDYFITEACEYRRSFLSLNPDIGVLLNSDYDHPDTYPDRESMDEAFRQFVEQSKVAVVEEECFKRLRLSAIDNAKDKIYTFGFGDDADFRAVNVKHTDGKFSFDLVYDGGRVNNITTGLYGRHNILNALAVLAVSYLIWLDLKEAAALVEDFEGVDRRFSEKGKLNGNGARVIVDYAHHPNEIAATIDTVRLMGKGKIIAVFEPHTYSRTKALLEDFGHCFYWADELIILPTYSAREKSEQGLDGSDLAEYINTHGEGALYLESYEKVCEYVKRNAGERDIVLALGAGSIDKLGDMLVAD